MDAVLSAVPRTLAALFCVTDSIFDSASPIFEMSPAWTLRV